MRTYRNFMTKQIRHLASVLVYNHTKNSRKMDRKLLSKLSKDWIGQKA